MTVLTTMALMVTAIAKNLRADRQDEKRIAKLEARIAELEDAIATANAQARRDQELIDLWRERALATPARQVVEFRPPQSALHQQAAGLQAAQAHLQQMANQAQTAQYQAMQQAMVFRQGAMLGAQGLIDAELWCNCVPARHDMFLRGE
jgi:uncharacterized coiled-coil protein SlyX